MEQERQEARRKMANNLDGIQEEAASLLVKNSLIDKNPKYVPENIFLEMRKAFDTKSMFENRVDIVVDLFTLEKAWEKIEAATWIPNDEMIYWFVNYIVKEMEGINLNRSWTVLVEGVEDNFTLRFLFEDANDMKELLDILSTLSL